MNNDVRTINRIIKPYYDKKEEIESSKKERENEENRIKVDLQTTLLEKNLYPSRLADGKVIYSENELDNRLKYLQIYLKKFELGNSRNDLYLYFKNALSDRSEEEIIRLVNDAYTLEDLYLDLRQMAQIKEKAHAELITQSLILKGSISELKSIVIQDQTTINNISKSLSYDTDTLKEFVTKLETDKKKLSRLESLLKMCEDNLTLLNYTEQEKEALITFEEEWVENHRKQHSTTQTLDNYTLLKLRQEQEKKNRKPYSDILPLNEEVYSPQTKVSKDGNTIVDSEEALLELVYNNIINEINQIDTIRINPSRLNLRKKGLADSKYYISMKKGIDTDFILSKSNIMLDSITDSQFKSGDYVSEQEFEEALEKYINKNKGLIYQVNRKKYSTSSIRVKVFKSLLKKCSAIKLQKSENLYLKNNQLVPSNDLELYIKLQSEKSFKEEALTTLKEETMKEGVYINKYDLVTTLENLFKKRKILTLKKEVYSINPNGGESSYQYTKK